ncbi:MAG: Choline-sulfatase [Planctomycetota bacterium]
MAGVPALAAEGLTGRVLCGYQGWFAAAGDGAGIGWNHWRHADDSVPVADQVRVDLLPDVSELAPEERFPLGIVDAAGRPVEVFSSYCEATVRRHFSWMREYGIDGVFVQRFATAIADPDRKAFHDTVLRHCRTAAETEQRVYAVMYDLTGLAAGRVGDVLTDWRALRRAGVGTDSAAIQVGGRPLVAVWGIGFAKGRRDYSLAECRDLVAALKADGCAVLVGVPTGWRTGTRDAVPDPLLREIVASADAVSPWTVGRYRTPEEASRHAASTWAPDLAWCRERGVEYLPVVFPGFSWKNLKGGPLDQIPRLRGRFFEQQLLDATGVGAQSLYVAMFDECDEGTAIFKCAEPPRGLEDRFVGLEGLRSDHYLRLAGNARRRLQNKTPRPK